MEHTLTISKISLGEMIAYLPIPGGHITLAERFVSKGFSFLLGWTYWYNWTVVLPAELRCISNPTQARRFFCLCSPLPCCSAAAILIGYWDEKTSPAVWITVCLVVVIGINMLGAGMAISV